VSEFWGACGDSLIVKYDTVVHKVVDGRFSIPAFELLDIIGNIITVNGYYYICNGGYTKFKFLVCPFKWPQSGTDMEFWSDAAESAKQDIEWCFGSMKNIWFILITPIRSREAFCVEQIFMACCVLHNILLDYNGGENWRGKMITVPRKSPKAPPRSKLCPSLLWLR
jgi:hypothetical protein